MRRLLLCLLATGLATVATPAAAQLGDLRIEIQQPAADLLLTEWVPTLEVAGGASVFGGVRTLDLFLVMDTSKSLQRNDPKDYRAQGAIGLVQSLPSRSDIQLGLVDFDRKARLISPLTKDRAAIVRALRKLDRSGATDLAAGIRTALEGFEKDARPDSSRVMLLFTDGRSDVDEARGAMQEARRKGVAIHALHLGAGRKGASILEEIAQATGGSFLPVTDPARLPEAFLNLRTTGVDQVMIEVNDSPPFPAVLAGGTFTANVPLEMGENKIVATATSLDGRTRQDSVSVVVSSPLTITIDEPSNGTLFTGRPTEMAVAGSFENLVPEFVAEHPEWAVQSVSLSVNDSPPFATTLEAGRFEGRVALKEGENLVRARVSTADGRVAENAITVSVRAPGCAELHVEALSEGEPALSVSDRAVEIVFDASNSMWGRMEGRPKISVAKEILLDTLDWLPADLKLGLRVYGHQHPRKRRNCTDSELLVPYGAGNRGRIRAAIAEFRPRGQTPLAHSLEQVASDLGDFRGERAVILVTDGIESCGGDPVAAARNLQKTGSIPVHVIGFGLGSDGDAASASLEAIASASGGRYLTASSADELREALTVTVGTPFSVRADGAEVARGSLGSHEAIHLPAGAYSVRLESAPPREVPVTLTSEEAVTLTFERRSDDVLYGVREGPADYVACPTAPGGSDPELAERELPEAPPAAPERD